MDIGQIDKYLYLLSSDDLNNALTNINNIVKKHKIRLKLENNELVNHINYETFTYNITKDSHYFDLVCNFYIGDYYIHHENHYSMSNKNNWTLTTIDDFFETRNHLDRMFIYDGIKDDTSFTIMCEQYGMTIMEFISKLNDIIKQLKT